jgi:hypothetical protein
VHRTYDSETFTDTMDDIQPDEAVQYDQVIRLSGDIRSSVWSNMLNKNNSNDNEDDYDVETNKHETMNVIGNDIHTRRNTVARLVASMSMNVETKRERIEKATVLYKYERLNNIKLCIDIGNSKIHSLLYVVYILLFILFISDTFASTNAKIYFSSILMTLLGLVIVVELTKFEKTIVNLLIRKFSFWFMLYNVCVMCFSGIYMNLEKLNHVYVYTYYVSIFIMCCNFLFLDSILEYSALLKTFASSMLLLELMRTLIGLYISYDYADIMNPDMTICVYYCLSAFSMYRNALLQLILFFGIHIVLSIMRKGQLRQISLQLGFQFYYA